MTTEWTKSFFDAFDMASTRKDLPMKTPESFDIRDELARLPWYLRILRYPPVFLPVTYLIATAVGMQLISDTLIYLLFDRGRGDVYFWTEEGLCGDFLGWQDIHIMACRMGLDPELIAIFLGPALVAAPLIWIVQSFRSRRPVWATSGRQRFKYLAPLYFMIGTMFLHSIATFQRDVALAAALDFNPLNGIVKSSFGILTPIVFWYLIGRAELRYLNDERK